MRYLAGVWRHPGAGVDVGQVLLDDPEMLQPFLAPSLGTLLVAPLVDLPEIGQGPPGYNVLSWALPLGLSLGLAPTADVLFRRRDAALSRAVLRALDAARALDAGAARRWRYSFRAGARAAPALRALSRRGAVPLLALRRPPGAAGDTVELVLWEPHCLSLVDDLANGGRLEGAVLGLVVPHNSFYAWGRAPLAPPPDPGPGPVRASASQRPPSAAAAHDDADAVRCPPPDGSPSDAETEAEDRWRTVDVVLPTGGWLGRVVRAEEQRGGADGDREVRVWVAVDRPVAFDRASVRHCGAGYLVARPAPPGGPPAGEGPGRPREGPLRCVCVVGLAHVNNVVRHLEGALP